MTETNTRTTAAFQTVRLLAGGFVVLSVLTLVAAYVLRNHADLVNDNVWIRGGIVAAASVVLFALARFAGRGHRGSYRRLRFSAIGMTVAIAVIVALPHFLPTWMRIEQGACGLLLLGVVLIVNRKHLRDQFATAG